MQASILLLVLLPAVLYAVPCTDTTEDPETLAPTTASPTTPEPTTVYVPPPRSFPNGTWSLPRPDAGCPLKSGGFKTFFRYWDTEDYYNANSWPVETEHFFGFMKRDGIKQYFCVKTRADRGGKYQWPRGDYCINKKGDCPIGFNEGSLFWDDENSENQNTKTSIKENMPDGEFTRDTSLDYCCRDDGSATSPIKLPVLRPFYLYRYKGTQCQEVADMEVTEEVVQWDDEDTGNSNRRSGAHPKDSGDAANHKLHFCYYQPPAVETQ